MMPAFERYSSSTIRRIASGASATSSWQMQKNPLSPSTKSSTEFAAAPNPGFAPSCSMNALGSTARDVLGDLGVGQLTVPGPLRARREQEERVEVRVVLPGEGVERLVEPGPRRVHDHHRHDGRRDDGFGFRTGWLTGWHRSESRLPAHHDPVSSRR